MFEEQTFIQSEIISNFGEFECNLSFTYNHVFYNDELSEIIIITF